MINLGLLSIQAYFGGSFAAKATRGHMRREGAAKGYKTIFLLGLGRFSWHIFLIQGPKGLPGHLSSGGEGDVPGTAAVLLQLQPWLRGAVPALLQPERRVWVRFGTRTHTGGFVGHQASTEQKTQEEEDGRDTEMSPLFCTKGMLKKNPVPPFPQVINPWRNTRQLQIRPNIKPNKT